ncbi:MAG: response regulator transcription factor [Lachnospiraceae bacterium]|nr:response regulator transcription factor [Lachnospiraceae bacterium]
MLRVLIVEDEASIRILIKARLKDQYEIIEAKDGVEALDLLDKVKVDLMIVDIMMPRMDGYQFVEELRNSGDMTPIILLTAMSDFNHKKKGFSLGIDDYLTKPIDYEELKWHIEAILRRSKINSEKEITIGDFKLSEDSMTAVWEDKTMVLTEKEFQLLHKLLSYPGTLFTKQQLMDDIWGYDSETDYNSIKTYINRLRNKFDGCNAFEIISSRGLGYKAEIRA